MKLKIQLRKSVIGSKPKQKKTVEALGLRRINHTVVKEATPELMGMVRKISHMISVEEIK